MRRSTRLAVALLIGYVLALIVLIATQSGDIVLGHTWLRFVFVIGAIATAIAVALLTDRDHHQGDPRV